MDEPASKHGSGMEFIGSVPRGQGRLTGVSASYSNTKNKVEPAKQYHALLGDIKPNIKDSDTITVSDMKQTKQTR